MDAEWLDLGWAILVAVTIYVTGGVLWQLLIDAWQGGGNGR